MLLLIYGDSMVILSPLGGIGPGLGIVLMSILGFSNLTLLILVWFTCRCRVRLIAKMKSASFYEKIFRLHCLFWKLLVISVLAHVIIGLMIFGIPF
jgi:hypothetical protein